MSAKNGLYIIENGYGFRTIVFGQIAVTSSNGSVPADAGFHMLIFSTDAVITVQLVDGCCGGILQLEEKPKAARRVGVHNLIKSVTQID